MTDLNKLLREKLEARDYVVTVGNGGTGGSAGNYVWHGNGNIKPQTPFTPIGEKLEEVRADIKQLDYILQRIVPNYDELVAQYRAIKDIEEAGE